MNAIFQKQISNLQNSVDAVIAATEQEAFKEEIICLQKNFIRPEIYLHGGMHISFEGSNWIQVNKKLEVYTCSNLQILLETVFRDKDTIIIPEKSYDCFYPQYNKDMTDFQMISHHSIEKLSEPIDIIATIFYLLALDIDGKGFVNNLLQPGWFHVGFCELKNEFGVPMVHRVYLYRKEWTKMYICSQVIPSPDPFQGSYLVEL
jgi:hypothetical protein